MAFKSATGFSFLKNLPPYCYPTPVVTLYSSSLQPSYLDILKKKKRCLFLFSLFIFFPQRTEIRLLPITTGYLPNQQIHHFLHLLPFSTETLLLTFLTLLYRVPSSLLTVPSQGYFFSFIILLLAFPGNKSFLSSHFVHYLTWFFHAPDF